MGLFNIIFLVHTLYLTDEAGIMTEEGVKELRIEYGIENILPEGKGLEIEREQWTVRKRVDSKVVIDKYGNAVLKSLLIDGKEIEF